MLPENCGVGLIKKNCASELEDWAKNLPISQKNSDFELPPIRGQNTDLVFDQKIAKSRQSNGMFCVNFGLKLFFKKNCL